ncbi:ABC transporter permease [Hyphomicrobium sp.]|uniref:ABC transporter permease n=1 Tax=Hyphomicrobium sp. TaxID=82 RepID=UPI002D771E4A|nr:ABC transporter permease [Hyphomicrobium sp.]HET6389241.1 ABC transporter permease [Hyphomicrobium sp.]
MNVSTEKLSAHPVASERQRRLFFIGMSLPGALATSVLVLFALGVVLFLGLRTNDGSLLGGAYTLGNLQAALTDPLYATVIIRSLAIAGFVTLATVVTAYPVAYYLAFHAGKHRGLLLFIVTLPFWTSYLLRVFAWKVVLAYNGVLNSALLTTGITSEPILAFLNTPAAVVVTLAHAYAAFAILPIYVALENVPKSLIEAAEDLGARPISIFRKIILPISMPGVMAAALVVFVPTVGDYVTPALVGGPNSTMIGSMIQAQFGKANDWPFGAALSVIVMVVILAVVVAARLADKRFGSRT